MRPQIAALASGGFLTEARNVVLLDPPDAANLFFQLVSSRYEHASLIVTSNLPFSGWGGHDPCVTGRTVLASLQR